MQIPEPPTDITKLDLLKRLKEYADGKATWLPDDAPLGEGAKVACDSLRTGMIDLTKVVAELLDKVNAKEMDTFTMHDRRHAIKVAHLMWHIIQPERRYRLTPPEIGMLVASAFLHDLGMFLSNDERDSRLAPESDLWHRLEIDDVMRKKFDDLRKQSEEETVEAKKKRLHRQLVQAEEALLCLDTRDRHATAERYKQIMATLVKFHEDDPTNMPNVESVLAFERDSFKKKLLDVCVSHNESAEMLVARDQEHQDRPRFPTDFPVGSVVADVHFVAAALRLADILDFDRERTPRAIYHYFLPGPLDPGDDRSVLEWRKHMAISNWEIAPDTIVFRGRCTSHIVHHAIVQFCDQIAEEIAGTQATFLSPTRDAPSIALPTTVKPDIHEDGYRYVPYKFELDDERIHSLLMGGAIYEKPLVAVRELVQNAVDACRLRDALTTLHQPEMTPSKEKRIFVEYYEPDETCLYPRLTVRDTGTGMDEFVLNRWFLKVGRSYYNSAEFNACRVQLRKADLDFAPVSEFGIGFLSCFLLADKVEVETAMWETIRGDTRKRILEIHGPTRLIRLSEDENAGPGRFRGTRITLTLTRGGEGKKPPTWEETEAYLRDICLDLPYRLHLRYVGSQGTTDDYIDRQPLVAKFPSYLESGAVRIAVCDNEAGIEGEIVLFDGKKVSDEEFSFAKEQKMRFVRDDDKFHSSLIRGGFRVGNCPGLPRYHAVHGLHDAGVLRLAWEHVPNRRFSLTDLARERSVNDVGLRNAVAKAWLGWLVDNSDDLPEGFILKVSFGETHVGSLIDWLERYDCSKLYRLARNAWIPFLEHGADTNANSLTMWERGEGGALPISNHRDQVWCWLLYLVLPRVSSLVLDGNGLLAVTPPSSGWKTTLSDSNDHHSTAHSWDVFAVFSGGIENLLWYSNDMGMGMLSERYRDRIEREFLPEELNKLKWICATLLWSRFQALMNEREVPFWRRTQKVLGDLEIGMGNDRRRLDSFTVADQCDS